MSVPVSADPFSGRICFLRLFVTGLLGATCRPTIVDLDAHMRLYEAAREAQCCLPDEPAIILSSTCTSKCKHWAILGVLSHEGVIEFDDAVVRSSTLHNTENPRIVSGFLANFFPRHESFLQKLAAKEQADGTFTLGFSRRIDLLDNARGWL